MKGNVREPENWGRGVGPTTDDTSAFKDKAASMTAQMNQPTKQSTNNRSTRWRCSTAEDEAVEPWTPGRIRFVDDWKLGKENPNSKRFQQNRGSANNTTRFPTEQRHRASARHAPEKRTWPTLQPYCHRGLYFLLEKYWQCGDKSHHNKEMHTLLISTYKKLSTAWYSSELVL